MTVTRNNDDQRRLERIIALARDLILIPTIPSRPEDRRRGFYFVRNHVDTLEHIRVREFEKSGLLSLVAAPVGCEHPDILLCAHLDVITHPNLSCYRSEIRNGRIYGPGAGDMKATLAILLELFRAIHRRHPQVSLGLAVTTDEEMGGEAGIGYLFGEVGMHCKEAIIPDGGSLQEITVEEKGILHLQCVCRGQPAHAARPWLGKNPIEILIDRIGLVRDYFASLATETGHWHPTCAVTVISTENETRNRIPAEARAVLDVRFPFPHRSVELLQTINDILGPAVVAHPIISAEPTLLAPDPRYASITAEVTGLPVKHLKDDGGSDARFIAKLGIPVAMSRPRVGNLHAVDEWIEIDSIMPFYQICHRYVCEKLGLPPGEEGSLHDVFA